MTYSGSDSVTVGRGRFWQGFLLVNGLVAIAAMWVIPEITLLPSERRVLEAWLTFPALALISIALLVINVFRIRILLADAYPALTFSRSLRVYMVFELFSKTTPAGLGGVASAMVLLQKYSVPSSACVGIFTTSAAFDALALLFILPASFSFFSKSDAVAVASIFLWVVFGISFALFFSMNSIRGRMQKYLGTAERSGQRYMRWLAWIFDTVNSIYVIGLRRTLIAALVSVVYWCVYLSTLFMVVFLVAGANPEWITVSLIQFAAMSIGQASLLPGGSGVVEASAIAGLSSLMSLETAAVSVIIWRSLTFYFYIVLGAGALYWERAVAGQNANIRIFDGKSS